MNSNLDTDIKHIIANYSNIEIIEYNNYTYTLVINNIIVRLLCPEKYPEEMYFYIESEHSATNEINMYILSNIEQLSLKQLIEKLNESIYNMSSTEYSTEYISDDDILLRKDNININDKIKIWEKHSCEIKKHSNTLSSNQIFGSVASTKILINELVSIMNTRDDILVEPIDNNIFEWNIKMYKFNEQFNEQLCQLNDKFQYNYLEIKLEFQIDLFPFYPPSVKLIRPRINDICMHNLSKLHILTFKNWNPVTTINDVLNEIINSVNIYGKIMIDDVKNSRDKYIYGSYMNIEYNLLNLSLLTGAHIHNNNNSVKEDTYWAAGTGFGHDGRTTWDINAYIAAENEKKNQICIILQDILKCFKIEDFNETIIEGSVLVTVIESYLLGTQLLDIDKNVELYKIIFELLDYIAGSPKLITDIIKNNMFKLNNDIIKINNTFHNHSNDLTTLILSIVVKINDTTNNNNNDTTNNNVNNDKYITALSDYLFDSFNIQDNEQFAKMNLTIEPSKECLLRISKELCSLQSSLPISSSSTIFLRVHDEMPCKMQFIITGPKDTPYSNGCYVFNMGLQHNYPYTCPQVLLQTTGNGTVRFNPNLYNCGKVCLSLLGTWSGTGGEKWHKDNSTLLQVLVSIQSLIFVDDPYFNEPSYERIRGTPKGDEASRKYNETIRYENMRWGILEQLRKGTSGFEDVIKIHFRLKKEEILEECNKWVNECFEVNKNKFNDVFKSVQIELNKL